MDEELYYARVADYDLAKREWATFEGEDPRFTLALKNDRYVRQIVAAEGNAPESVSRALRYYDRHTVWLGRASAYHTLAEQLDPAEATSVAMALYEFTVPLLAEDLPRHATASDAECGKTLENVISYLNMSIAMTGDPQLIELQQIYLRNGFRERIIASDDYDDPARGALTADYYINDFDARINPEAHCGRTRELTVQEQKAGAFVCRACSQGFFTNSQPPEREPYGSSPNTCIVSDQVV